MKSAHEGAWGPQQFPNEKQRWNFLEKIYADYNEVNLQQQEIADRKREMMAQFPGANKDEIYQVLFSEDPSNYNLVGNWETYEKVKQILKKFVYCRSKNLFDPAKPDAVFSERIDILLNTTAEQRQRIASLERSLASAQDELAGLMDLLQMKDKEIKRIKMSSRVEMLNAAHTQRMMEGSDAKPSGANQNLYKDMGILLEINKTLERQNARLRSTLNARASISSQGTKIRGQTKKKFKNEHATLQKDKKVAPSTVNASEEVIANANLDKPFISDNAPMPVVGRLHSEDLTSNGEGGCSFDESDAMEKADNMLNIGEESAGERTPRGNRSHSTGTVMFLNPENNNAEDDNEATVCNTTFLQNMKDIGGVLKLSNFSENTHRENPEHIANFEASFKSGSKTFYDQVGDEALEKLTSSLSRRQYILEEVPITALLMRLREEREIWEKQLEAEVAHNMSCRDYDANAECVRKHDVECGSDNECIQSSWLSQDDSFKKTDDFTIDFDAFNQRTCKRKGKDLHSDSDDDVVSEASNTKDTPWHAMNKGTALFDLNGQLAKIHDETTSSEDLPWNDNNEQTAFFDDNGQLNKMHDDKTSREGLPWNDNNENTASFDDNVQLAEMHDDGTNSASSNRKGFIYAEKGRDQDFLTADSQRLVFTGKLSSKNLSQSAGADESHNVAILRTQAMVESSPQNSRRGDGSQSAFCPSLSGGELEAVKQPLTPRGEGSNPRKAGGTDKMRVKKKTSSASRRATGSYIKASKIVCSLKNEITSIKNDQSTMIGEMNEFFYHMGQLLSASQEQNESLQNDIQAGSEAFAAKIAEDVVKSMVEQRLIEQLEKVGIVLQRYPGPSSGLTDEEWLQNQLYDLIFKSSRDNIVKRILSGNNKEDVKLEAQSNFENLFSQDSTSQASKGSQRKTHAETKKVDSFSRNKNNKEEIWDNWNPKRVSARDSTSEALDSKAWPFFIPLSSYGGGLEDANASSGQTGTAATSTSAQRNFWDGAGTGISPFGSRGSFSGRRRYGDIGSFIGNVYSEHPSEGKESLHTERRSRVFSNKFNYASPIYHRASQGHSNTCSESNVLQKKFKGNVLKYLQSLQPREKLGGVHNMAPTAYQCFFLSSLQKATINVQRTIRFAAAQLQGPGFEKAFRSNILPYATAAKSLQNGRRVAPWILAAIRQLRIEEIKRNQRLRRVIFQRVVTNVRATRFLKKNVCKGSAIASFVIILWRKWLENSRREHARLRLEKDADLNRMLDIISFNVLSKPEAKQYGVREEGSIKDPLSDPSSSHFNAVKLPFKRM